MKLLGKKTIARVDKDIKSTLTALIKKQNKKPLEQLDLFQDNSQETRDAVQQQFEQLMASFGGGTAQVKVTGKDTLDIIYRPVASMQKVRFNLKPWIRIQDILDKDQLHKMGMGDVEERIEAALWAQDEQLLTMIGSNDWLQAKISEWRLGGSKPPDDWTPEQLEHHLDTWR